MLFLGSGRIIPGTPQKRCHFRVLKYKWFSFAAPRVLNVFFDFVQCRARFWECFPQRDAPTWFSTPQDDKQRFLSWTLSCLNDGNIRAISFNRIQYYTSKSSKGKTKKHIITTWKRYEYRNWKPDFKRSRDKTSPLGWCPEGDPTLIVIC